MSDYDWKFKQLEEETRHAQAIRLVQAWKLGTALAPRPPSPASLQRTNNQPSHSYALASDPRVIPSCAAPSR